MVYYGLLWFTRKAPSDFLVAFGLGRLKKNMFCRILLCCLSSMMFSGTLGFDVVLSYILL